MNPLLDFQLLPLVQAALQEDIRSGDITTGSLIPPTLVATAQMNFRQAGIVCGLDLARLAFTALDPGAKVTVHSTEGESVPTGTTVLEVRCLASALLTAERVALNFVQRLCGIATLTSRYVKAVDGTKARIVDIRKTTPGLRLLEKYAVRCGGGSNHRFGLDDLILIKDNHIALCGGIEVAISRARAAVGHSVKIEVECDLLEQVEQAVQAKADIILLDNMTPAQMAQAVSLVAGRALTEASGGINLDTVRGAAESGVDLISVGALTHGAASLDIGLDIAL